MLDTFNGNTISEFNIHILKNFFILFGFKTKIYRSSELNYLKKGGGQDKILSICNLFQANQYLNLPGGFELYNAKDFQMLGIDLRFINNSEFKYKQFIKNSFIPNLSILDFLFFNKKIEGVFDGA